jgi:hypothetical protein
MYFLISGQDRERSTLDVLLSTTYSRSQLYLSRQLAQLHPELTMPMFSGEQSYFVNSQSKPDLSGRFVSQDLFKCHYSGDLNIGLVQYMNGQF